MNKVTSFAAFSAVAIVSQAATTSFVGVSEIQVDLDTNPFGIINSGSTTATGVAIDGASSVPRNGNVKSFVITGDYDGDGIATDTLSFDFNYFVDLVSSRIDVEFAVTPDPANASLNILQLGDVLEHPNVVSSVRLFVDNVSVSYSDVSSSTLSTDFELLGFFAGDSGVVEISDATNRFTSLAESGFINLETDNTGIGAVATKLTGSGTLLNHVAGDKAPINLSGLFIQATVNAVPEPSSVALLGLGGLALLARRKR